MAMVAAGQAAAPTACARAGPDANCEPACRPLVLVTTVELGGGRSTDICVRQGNSAEVVAQRFISDNGLPAELLGPLLRHLQANLQEQPPLPKAVHRQPLADRTPGRPGSPLAPRGLDSAMGKLGRAPAHVTPPAGGGGGKPQGCLKGSLPASPRSDLSPEALRPHLRLYEQARSLQQKLEQQRQQRAEAVDCETRRSAQAMGSVSRQLTAGRGAGRVRNSGERLYLTGLHDLERRRAEAERVRALRAEEEAAAFTGTPRLSRMARQLRRGSQPWERLHAARISSSRERVLQEKAAAAEAEALECTFQPAINARSELIAAAKASAAPRCESLYLDATHRQQRRESLTAAHCQQFTFAPRLQGPRFARSLPAPVGERLHQVQKDWQARAQARKWLQERPVDAATGRPLFQPQTGRQPAFVRNRAGDIGAYLHSIQSQRDFKSATLAGRREQERAAATVPRALGRSEQLVARLKAKRFGLVYGYLTRGQADATQLDLLALAAEPDSPTLAALHAEVRDDVQAAARILARRLAAQEGSDGEAEAEQESSSVGLDDFCQLMEAAVAGSGGPPRAYLAPAQAAARAVAHSHRPAIDARSRALATARLRPAGEPVFELLHRTASDMQQRHLGQLMAQQDAALEECTFKPDLSLTRGASTAAAARLSLRRPAADADAGASPQTFEELEQEVEAALRECEQLGLPPARPPAEGPAALPQQQQQQQQANAGRAVPTIQRWTSDQDGYVAELGPEATVGTAA